jgi:signal transduction histidine kinase
MRRFLILLCEVWLALLAVPVHAAEPQLLSLAVLEDRDGTQTIGQVADLYRTTPERFRPLPGPAFSGGYTRSAHWLRIEVAAPGEEWWLGVLPALLDDLRLYTPDAQNPGRYTERRTGDTLPFAADEVGCCGFIFRFTDRATGPQTYFLRLQTTSASVTFLHLATPVAYMARSSIQQGLMFASIAVVFVSLLFSLNAWYWLRDSLTPWFIAYLVLQALSLAGNFGLLHRFIYPDSTTLNNLVVNLATTALIAFGYGFYRRLFAIDRTQPLLYWLYEGNFLLALGALIPAIIGYHIEAKTVLTLFILPMNLLGVALSLHAWRRGLPGGTMMLAANLFGLTGISFFVLLLRGAIAGGPTSALNLPLSAIAAILALQLALGARYRTIHEARIHAENDARHERQAREEFGQFFAMLAHEMRTALAVLKMALGQKPMTPQAEASADRAIDAMRDIIERSIEAETLGGSPLSSERYACDAAALLDELIAATPAAGRIRVEVSGKPSLQTDPTRLRAILLNLIDNAGKYSPPDSPIDIHLEATASGMVLQVTNDVGPAGYPDANRVFERYYRASSARGQSGSGLGLYIARSMAHSLGGSLDYLPTDRRPSFRLTL